MTAILSVQNLSVGHRKNQVLFNVNLDVVRSEILTIVGGTLDWSNSLCPKARGHIRETSLATSKPAHTHQDDSIYYLAYKP